MKPATLRHGGRQGGLLPTGIERALQGAALQYADGIGAALGVYALAIVQEPFRREPRRKATRRTVHRHSVRDIAASGELLDLHRL
jgi:hypothetical protein